MKLFSYTKGKTSFYKKDKLEIFATAVKGKITQFEVHNGKVKVIKVTNSDFLAAWKKLETYLKKIK